MADPTWLTQLKPASWRGIRFEVDTLDLASGDVALLREYPFQDLPRVIYMGRAADEFKLSAYVMGDDYLAQRDALEAALRDVPQEGGVLIHPTRGAIRCWVVGKPSIKEAILSEGGLARFEISLVRAQAGNLPEEGAATEQLAEDAAAALDAAAAQEFAQEFGQQGLPSWARERLADRLAKLVDLSWLRLSLPGLRELQDFGIVSIAINNLQFQATALLGDAVRLAQSVQTIFRPPLNWDRAAIVGGFKEALNGRGTPVKRLSVADLPVQAQDGRALDWMAALRPILALDGLAASNVLTQSITPSTLGNISPGASGLTLYLYGQGQAIPASPIEARLARLTYLLDALFLSAALAAAVRAATQITLRNADEALALRAEILQWHRELLLEMARQRSNAASITDAIPALPWFQALMGCQAAALQDLQARSVDLNRLTSYTPQSWQPVWYVSHQLYGSVKYADEILAMNPHITHPLLVQPGRALRVVRHD